MRLDLIFACSLLFLAVIQVEASIKATVQPLPKNVQLRANANTFTVSGISAGGAMAVQFHFAYSSIIQGAGIVAGLPYQCSQGSLAGAMECMYSPFMISQQTLVDDINLNADLKLIDPTSNLASQTVMLFSGLLDSLVPQSMMQMVQSIYKSYNVANITGFFDYPAEHAWITNAYGNGCSYLGSPYVNNCDLDFGGKFYESVFANLNRTWNATKGTVNVNNMYSFDQTQFGANPLSNSLATSGYIYIPTACYNQTFGCHLHMNFHGCEQSSSQLGPLYVLQTELNEWAESNNIVIIYPQATTNDLVENPNACFDWWGYAGDDYAQQGGAQIAAFRAMVKYYGGF